MKLKIFLAALISVAVLVAGHYGLFHLDPVALLALPLLGTLIPGGFPGKAMFDLTQAGGEHREDVAPLIEIYSDAETPILTRIGMGEYPAYNIKHEWLEDELIPDTSILQGALAAGVATSTVAVSNVNAFQVGEQIAIGQLPHTENCLVTAVSGGAGTVTLSRGYGATTAVAWASGETILLMGECSIEGDDAPDSQKTNMDRVWNLTTIFNYTIEMTGTRLALIPRHLGDIGDEFAYERRKRMIEALRDLEAQVIVGDFAFAGGAPSQGSATVARTMRGIVNMLRFGVYNNAGALVTPPANCYANAGGINFSFDNWVAQQQSVVYNNGARDASLLVIPPALKLSVSKWKRTAQLVQTTMGTPEQRRITEKIADIDTDYGLVECLMMPRMAFLGNVSLLLSPRQIKVLNLLSRSFFIIPLGMVGDRRREELVGEYTQETKGISQGWHSLVYGWTAL